MLPQVGPSLLQMVVVQPQPHYISQYVAPLPAYEPMK